MLVEVVNVIESQMLVSEPDEVDVVDSVDEVLEDHQHLVLSEILLGLLASDDFLLHGSAPVLLDCADVVVLGVGGVP